MATSCKKIRIEKSPFSNDISVEYKVAKHSQDYTERKNSQVCPKKTPLNNKPYHFPIFLCLKNSDWKNIYLPVIKMMGIF